MSNSSQPHGLQPNRLLCPCNSLGKNTGMCCHFFLQEKLNIHMQKIGIGPLCNTTHGLSTCLSGERTCLPRQELQETWVQSLGLKDPLEEDMAIRSSILAWRIPWKEEPSGFSPWGPKGSVMTELAHITPLRLPWWHNSKESPCNAGDTGSIPGLGRFPWRRKWQPPPAFLPGKSHG